MPHFLAQLTKQLGQEKWSNVYYIQADNLNDANSNALDIMGIERAVTKSTVSFVHLLTSEREQPFRNYKSQAINEVGLVTPTMDELPLPLWNTVRCEFQPSNAGKPDVKQLRIPIYTDEIVDIQHLTTTFHSFIDSNYTGPLVELGYIEDDAGNIWLNGLTRTEIFDRQLTKRRRKKVTA